MVDDVRPLYANKMTVEELERERKMRGSYPKALMKRKCLTPDLGMGNNPEGVASKKRGLERGYSQKR
jgi:hypothetical protein